MQDTRMDTLEYALGAMNIARELHIPELTNGARFDAGSDIPPMPLFDGIRLDASSSGYLREALTSYDPRLLRDEYPERKYANGIVPISSKEMVGVRNIHRTRVTRVGNWRMSGEGNSTAPPIDIGLGDVEYGNYYFDAHIKFTTKELDEMAFQRRAGQVRPIVDTVREKMRAVNESYQDLLNRCFSTGYADKNIYGLHSHPGIAKVKSPYKIGLTVSTPDAAIAVLTLGRKVARANSGQATYIDTMVMPDGLMTELNQQTRNTAASVSTLQSFFNNDPDIRQIATTPEADYAGPGGTSLLHFYRKDANRVEACIPKRMRQKAAPYLQNGHYRVDFDCSISGVHVVRPYDHVIVYDVYDAV